MNLTNVLLTDEKDNAAFNAWQNGKQGMARYLHKKATNARKRVARTIDHTLHKLATAALTPLLATSMTLPSKSDSDEFNASEYNEIRERLNSKRSASHTIWQDGSDTVASDAQGIEISRGTNAATVIQAAYDALPSGGGKLTILEGTYEVDTKLAFEDRRDPDNGTVTIEGEGFNKNTVLKCTASSEIEAVVSLKGSSHHVIRNLGINANSNAKWGIQMQRASTGGAGAGNHHLSDIGISNANHAGILSYGAENVYMENVRAGFGCPIGLLSTAHAPVSDPTVTGSNAVDTDSSGESNNGLKLVSCQFGDDNGTTKASMIVYSGLFTAQDVYLESADAAEANVIIDETPAGTHMAGVWIDSGAQRGFRIGHYTADSNRPSSFILTGVTIRDMPTSAAMEIDNARGFTILNVSTTQNSGVITVNPGDTSVSRGIIGQFVKTDGTYRDVDLQNDPDDMIILQGGVQTETLSEPRSAVGVTITDPRVPTRTQVGSDTLTRSDSVVLVDATGGVATINLPDATLADGHETIVKKIDSSGNNVVLDPPGAQTIDGASTYTLSGQWDSVRVVSDGTDWFIAGTST